ncbi:MAG TPA: BREX-1 system phosphatase PglZ type B [Pirellulales bacterium]|nr:BREX-1 system phosphatase PglZ type B [Pirellulales bacterium]
MTVFDSLLTALERAADHNRDDAVAPAAVLWPDEKREWERLVPRLRVLVPHFLVLGQYELASRTGPAIWLRCVLAGKVPAVTWQSGTVPIIYLPGVSRATLRATEDCPNELKPLAELQYRGVFWSQSNGKDWTITAYLQTNHGGLQLKIAKDQATASATRRALEKLMELPVAELRAKSASGELNSHYFHLLISDDPVDDLLSWLADREAARQRMEHDRWEALCSDCLKNYGFDPKSDGPLVGAEHLGLQTKTAWKTAWNRFASAPSRYSGLIEQLRRAKPKEKGGPLFNQPEEFWPQDNEAAEADLREGLRQIGEPRMKHGLNTDKEIKEGGGSTSDPCFIRFSSVAEARKRLHELEERHKQRRGWVWARMKLAPLADALEHLAKLAESTRTPLAGATIGDMARLYTEAGWRADAAALDAVAAVSSAPDRDVVSAAVAQVYSPWLRDAAELFQERAMHEPLPGRTFARLSEVPSGTCLLFADGLRYDLAQKVKAALEAKQIVVQLKHQFVALPSVTPTAKPAVSPVADKLTGTAAGEEFRPCLAADQKELTIERFRNLLAADGYQVLGVSDHGEPAGRAWTEFGDVDKTGHEKGVGLARRIPELVASLVERVESLLSAGWREVRIVTDHGWLLVPKGLPKTDLPKYLTATRWGRCAVVKPAATVDLPCFAWFWSDDVRIACPPGIDSFIAGKEYGHGGLSLQECWCRSLRFRLERSRQFLRESSRSNGRVYGVESGWKGALRTAR